MKWTCRLCTLDNEIINNFCLICEAPKPEERNHKNHILSALNNFHIANTNFRPLYDFPPLDIDPPEPQEFSQETENDEIYEQINNYCQLSQTPFMDDIFPPTKKSIGSYHKFKNLPRNVVWLRPNEIISRRRENYFSWDVFRDPSPLDIKQGAVGNCWLISCIALIAERPDILDKIILTKTYNPNGIYKIQLCIDGIYQTVYIDDYFPCDRETNEMVFVQGRHNQLWPSLIEKALAKILGNYESLISGLITEGLIILTGAPCEKIETKFNYESQSEREYEKHKIWSKLCSAKESNFLIGAGCGSHSDNYMNKRDFEMVGLVKNHAYSILDVKHYKENKLVKLRNPWDNFAWKGEWGKDWLGWTEAARRDLEFERERNNEKNGGGTFWMPFDSFLRYFDSIEFAYIREYSGWKEQRFLFEISPQNCETFYLSFTERTEICFNVFQRNVWKIPDKSDVMILVHKNNYGQPGELVSKSKRQHTSSVLLKDAFYEAGDYIIIVISITAICNNSPPLSCALAIHSSKQITIIPQQNDYDFYRKSMIQFALSYKPEKETFPNMYLYKIKDKGFNGFLYMAENYDHEMHFQINLDASNSINVNSSRNALIVADSIPPMHRQILLILTTAKPTEASTFVFHSNFRSSNSPYLHSNLTHDQFCLHSPPSMNLFDLHETTPMF